jgi:hypothetical protein
LIISVYNQYIKEKLIIIVLLLFLTNFIFFIKSL